MQRLFLTLLAAAGFLGVADAPAAALPVPGGALAQVGAAVPPDSVRRLRNHARNAEAAFERLSRHRAPVTYAGGGGQRCDEIIGRFCVWFDSTSPSTRPTAEEAGAVIDARRSAIEAQRRFFSASPQERRAAAPLVRLLVADERPREAASTALTFAALGGEPLWAALLLGYASRANGELGDAQRHFTQALVLMDDGMRREWSDPTWLLDPREQRALRRLDGPARDEYERRFWLLADPLWLTDENERWIEHMARRAETRLHAEVPRVAGMVPWGRDLDEITLRWGVPVARAQVATSRVGEEARFVEYFDTAQRAYVPERLLTEGMTEPPLPGDPPPLYAARARSQVRVPGLDRVVDLPHQVTRFLSGRDVVLRVDGRVPAVPDSVATGTVRLGLFAYDSALTRRSRSLSQARRTADSLDISLFVRAPPGQLIYSVEALDSTARVGARARYVLPAFIPEAGPVVSDLLISAPFEGADLPDRRDHAALRPHAVLEVERGATIGVYAEVYRLSAEGPEALRIEFSLEPAGTPGVLGQIARWIGRATGIAPATPDPRVAWQAESADAVHPLAVNLPLDPSRRGRQALVLRVTDTATGAVTESRRILLVRDR